MKINTLSAMSLKAVCLGATLFGLTSLAGAETLNAHIPFDFTAGAKTMPAGEYMFSMETGGVLLIRGTAADPASVILAVLPAATAAAPSAAFEKAAGMAVLSKITLQNGVAYSLPAQKHGGKLLPLAEGGALATRR